jgi:hypothetical protein
MRTGQLEGNTCGPVRKGSNNLLTAGDGGKLGANPHFLMLRVERCRSDGLAHRRIRAHRFAAVLAQRFAARAGERLGTNQSQPAAYPIALDRNLAQLRYRRPVGCGAQKQRRAGSQFKSTPARAATLTLEQDNGAFLDVRNGVIDDTLEDAFRRHCRGFRPATEEETTAAAA